VSSRPDLISPEAHRRFWRWAFSFPPACQINCSKLAFQPRTPARKSSNGVQSPRLFRKLKSRHWLRKRLATGFEHFLLGNTCNALSQPPFLLKEALRRVRFFFRGQPVKIAICKVLANLTNEIAYVIAN